MNITFPESQTSLQIFLGIRKSTSTRDHSVWSEDLSGDFRGSSVGDVSTNRRNVVLLQSGMDDKWCADSFECYCHLRNVQDLLTDGNTLYSTRFGEPLKDPMIRFGAVVAGNLERRYVGCRIITGCCFFPMSAVFFPISVTRGVFSNVRSVFLQFCNIYFMRPMKKVFSNAFGVLFNARNCVNEKGVFSNFAKK